MGLDLGQKGSDVAGGSHLAASEVQSRLTAVPALFMPTSHGRPAALCSSGQTLGRGTSGCIGLAKTQVTLGPGCATEEGRG